MQASTVGIFAKHTKSYFPVYIFNDTLFVIPLDAVALCTLPALFTSLSATRKNQYVTDTILDRHYVMLVKINKCFVCSTTTIAQIQQRLHKHTCIHRFYATLVDILLIVCTITSNLVFLRKFLKQRLVYPANGFQKSLPGGEAVFLCVVVL